MDLFKKSIILQIKDIVATIIISLLVAIPMYFAWRIINSQPITEIIPVSLRSISYLGFASIFFTMQIINKCIPTLIKITQD